MKVFDCFTFFNELELLEFRLTFLNDYVDYFVIAESNLTFSGKQKPYHFEAKKEKFREWEHKIIYLPIKQSTKGGVLEKDTKYNPLGAAWQLEYEQRNALIASSKYMNDDDLVLISDIDEIPDPKILKKLKLPEQPKVFSMLFHYYFLNCQNKGNQSRWWHGSIVCSAKQFKEITPQGLRNNRDVYGSIKHGGWHFSFLGGAENIKKKIESFAHTEYNQPEYVEAGNIDQSIKEGKDVLKRDGVVFKVIPLSYYPVHLQKIMRRYPQFLNIKPTGIVTNLYYTIRRILKRRF